MDRDGKLQSPWTETCDQHTTSYDRKQIRMGANYPVFLEQAQLPCSPCPGMEQKSRVLLPTLCLLPRVEFVKLASEEADVVNLGQGFPDFSPPEFAVEAFQHAVSGDFMLNQYTKAFVSLPAPLGAPRHGSLQRSQGRKGQAALSGEQANLDVRVHGAEPLKFSPATIQCSLTVSFVTGPGSVHGLGERQI